VKTVPRNVQVVAQDELPGLGDLPEALSVALADIVGVAREGLLALSAATGMSVMQAMFEAEVTAVAGLKGRHDRARTAVRHGTEKGSVTLRPGNAGSNTAADHLTVVDAALMQLPDRWRSKPILIRADGAGYSHALISALSQQGLEFSVGYPVTEAVRDAIALVPKWAWQVASNADGLLREHADVVEVTKMLDLSNWAKTCPDMRVIVRRELPHPGATLDAFEIRDGYRYQAFTTNTARGQLAFLEARHRAHARVEDRIRTGKDTGLGHLPSRHQNINEVWTELALIAADLLALAQTMLLTAEPELHRAEPKTLRYRLLHTAARITHGQRKVFLRLAEHWPWALALAKAFQRLRTIPLPT